MDGGGLGHRYEDGKGVGGEDGSFPAIQTWTSRRHINSILFYFE